MVKNTFFLLLFFLGIVGASTGRAQEIEPDIQDSLRFISRCNDFSDKPKSHSKKWWKEETNELRGTAMLLIQIYQKWLSPQDTPSCNFTVTCSRFAWESIRMYGIIGVFMTADRLLRCHPLSRIYYPFDPNLARSIDYPISWYAPKSSEEN